ncbi:pentapeptide repeat-containing protein [Nonomuraea sp. NPDC050540]|uniref:pentapeptide repeat-containing protein n=1 Tax=Nonomuraea sp. NPDC050540 TaxID=3364367 RepID=UPI00379CAFE8
MNYYRDDIPTKISERSGKAEVPQMEGPRPYTRNEWRIVRFLGRRRSRGSYYERLVSGTPQVWFKVLLSLAILLGLSGAANLWEFVRPWIATLRISQEQFRAVIAVCVMIPAVLLGRYAARRILTKRKRADGISGFWGWILGGLLLALIAFWVSLQVMKSTAGTDPQLQMEAIKTALTVGAGTGGALALVLAVRRHQLQERAQYHTELDAEEKRITELYVKAVELLGDSNASVRLGGLYALERLAQSHSEHRQTIINVFCACLRKVSSPDESTAEEKRVKLAIQEILTNHLRPSIGSLSSSFWGNIVLELSGVELEDFTLRGCHVRSADFSNTRFIGEADFSDSAFGWATFDCAEFSVGANFAHCEFAFTGSFKKIRTSGGMSFKGAKVRSLKFDGAKFGDSVSLDGIEVMDELMFDSVELDGDASLRLANLGGLGIHKSTFLKDLNLESAVVENLWITETELECGLSCSDSHLSHCSCWHVKIGGRADFSNTSFSGRTSFCAVTFNGDASFNGATCGRRSGLMESREERPTEFEEVEFRSSVLLSGIESYGPLSFSRCKVIAPSGEPTSSGLVISLPVGWRCDTPQGQDGTNERLIVRGH